ncbi:inverse autotransporter beta domain-containing protein [Enterobacter bugandensis]|uniref:inverse autotransporter beta domain-containing protein n=1 Tax=Enterobacter bugandensis TaxID=881260 RepID=UPI0020059B34|nr:inverse autotransporter beta domain-containing protein [Enterobacter bugandensis]MCK6880134.1 inverse autotransporter beta domain-containing protein [Enterobacter bugandensis]
MTPEELYKFNQFRTFAHGFEHLQAGDELDVPLTPLPQVKWDEPVNPGTEKNAEQQIQGMAGLASQAGNFLSSRPDGDAAAAMLRGTASGAVSNELQQWLGQFGTARVQLDTDKNFSLKNSQFDLLVPLYDRDTNMVFTQGSLHRTDDRTQTNLGVGFRHFSATDMTGASLFGDYDLSRYHARIGLGLEYWRDNLKLGANAYQRLTGWRDSPELTDYEARPANGWDIRAQAWVPSLPQLGGKLTYEQYYGDEVALFSTDKRQHNPHAITAGVSYTPVPLVTFSVEQRQGQSGQNDTRLGVELNYQPGVAWQQQVNPDAVAAMRSLAGSRYDLVERNNSIVLEYRKKEVISLYTVSLLTGYAGEQKSLGVSVNSKYGLASVEWSAAPLQAAGGRIVQDGAGGYSVVLPAWQAGVQGVNSYTVSGVAVDTKGNRSERRDTQVTVQAPVVNVQNSTFSPARSTLSADGKSTQVLTLSVRDGQGQAVDVAAGDITLTTGALKSATVSAAVRQSAGVYTVTVTAGKDPETVTVTPVAGGVTLSSAVVTLVTATPAQLNSVITVDKNAYVTGTDIRVIVTLKDINNNPVTGAASLLNSGTVGLPNATMKSGNWVDNKDGTYNAVYTAGTAGTALKATLRLTDWSGTVTSAAYTITADAPAQESSAIMVDSTSYITGSNIKVTVTLRDAGNNPVPGESAQLNASNVTVPNATPGPEDWKDNGDGSYTSVWTAITAGSDLKAAIKLGSWSSAVTSGAYSIKSAAPVQANSLISVDKSAYTAGDEIRLTVTLKDASNAPVTGAAAALSAVIVPNAALKSGSWTDNNDGTYAAVYTANTTGTDLKATLQLSSWSGPVSSAGYTITVGSPLQANSLIAVDNTTYTAGGDIKVTVTLKDSGNNAVTGADATLSAVIVPNAALKSGSWTGHSDGTYTAVYTAITAGTGLKATLKLDSWSAEISSAAYVITASTPALANSLIAVDNTTYIAGRDVKVTVTLRDSGNNPVSGAAATLTGVTVPNTLVKSGNWTDNNDGTYTGEYIANTAGTGLKATLQLSSWSGAVSSSAYNINVGPPVQVNSTIALDNITYISRHDMGVTVTLRDTGGNLVTGGSSLLTTSTVTIPGSVLKSGTNWIDNNDGTYSATYTVITAGTGLTAELLLTDWNTPSRSAEYSITAGPPAEANSSITVEGGTTYRVGERLTFTIVLKDANNNFVTGQVAQGGILYEGNFPVGDFPDCSFGYICVAGVGNYKTTRLQEVAPGTYTSMADLDGQLITGGKATLKLPGWSNAVQSGTFNVTVGEPVVFRSSIGTTNSSYRIGDDMIIVARLSDYGAHPVTGALSLFGAVTVEGAILKLGGDWKDNADGTYTATYTAVTRRSAGNVGGIKLQLPAVPVMGNNILLTGGNYEINSN